MTQPDKKSANAHPGEIARDKALEKQVTGVRDWCSWIGNVVNDYLRDQCRRKFNQLRHCSDEEGSRCPCTIVEGNHGKCQDAAIPDLAPCISIAWGDSKCDCMETDDTEVLCITVCNCYSNVTFRSLTIGFLYPTDANGNSVPTLPDGTPSVQIHPVGPICFGDIGPCVDGRGTCVSREVVLTTRGARNGGYRIFVGSVCFSVSLEYTTNDCFTFELCRD